MEKEYSLLRLTIPITVRIIPGILITRMSLGVGKLAGEIGQMLDDL